MKLNHNLQISEVVKSLLLPVQLKTENTALDKIIEYLASIGIEQTDHAQYIKNLFEDWRSSQKPTPELISIISISIEEADDAKSKLIAEKYFSLHEYLTNEPFFDFELSTIVLSHLRFIIHCAEAEDMSASKITAVLISIDSRLGMLRWRNTQEILNKLHLKPAVDKQDLIDLYDQDVQLADYYFADSTMYDACTIVGDIAVKLNYYGDLEYSLSNLICEKNLHKPYLQILHYQSTISAFYDHDLLTAYEFSPRGVNATWLFEKWQLATSNPILNNAKAVDTLDMSWANARKPNEYPAAKILAEILNSMNQMGFSAQKELAAWIRRWLVRFIQLSTEKITPVLTKSNNEKLVKVLSGICCQPTQTYGILEQRFVDLISAYTNQLPTWRPRGLGDSVNVNNLSKAKLGDCDFQNSINKNLIAYEAHGGKLTQVYFDGHIKTLARSLAKRSEDLESIGSPEDWDITVVFIAYDFGIAQPDTISILGYSIKFELITFSDFFNSIDTSSDDFRLYVKKLFVQPINELRTPHFVREKIKALL